MIEMYGAKDMHRLAIAKALELGPRLIRANGELLAIYGLSKKELKKLFVVDNGYSPKRSAWLSVIDSWSDPDLWGDVVAREFLKDGNWNAHVVFMYAFSSEDITRLKLYAEKHNARAMYYEYDTSQPTYDLSKLEQMTPVTTPDVIV